MGYVSFFNRYPNVYLLLFTLVLIVESAVFLSMKYIFFKLHATVFWDIRDSLLWSVVRDGEIYSAEDTRSLGKKKKYF